jgi:hypothetical protein
MKRIIMMLTVAAFLVAALTVSAASAFATPAADACTDSGGTYVQVSQSGPNKYECQKTTEFNPSGNDNPNAATPMKKTESTSQPGQGDGGGETFDTNPNGKEKKGPTTNPGGGTPGGQQ